jgi:hypothetical protein
VRRGNETLNFGRCQRATDVPCVETSVERLETSEGVRVQQAPLDRPACELAASLEAMVGLADRDGRTRRTTARTATLRRRDPPLTACVKAILNQRRIDLAE